MEFPEHFSLAELTTTGNHPGTPNDPGPVELAHLEVLAAKLESTRTLLSLHFGKEQPIKITYGFRGALLNHLVGGSPTSAHRDGLAADMVFPGCTLNDAYQALTQDPGWMLDVDQLIFERGCLHVGLLQPGRDWTFPRHELRSDATAIGLDGRPKRTYPLIGIWRPQ